MKQKQPSRKKVTRALRKVCTRYLWRAVPEWLEEEIIDEAVKHIPKKDINTSPHGQLLTLAAEMTSLEQGYGSFGCLNGEEIEIKPSEWNEVPFYEPSEAYVKFD